MTDTNELEQEPRSGLSDLTVKLGGVSNKDVINSCVCKPVEWFGEVKPICDEFISDEGHDQCKKCEHGRACHKTPNVELTGSALLRSPR